MRFVQKCPFNLWKYPLHPSRCLTSTASLHTWLAFSDTLMNCSACCNGKISTHSLQGTEFLLGIVCVYVRRGIWASLWQGQIAWTRSNLAGRTPGFYFHFFTPTRPSNYNSALATQSSCMQLRFYLLFLPVFLLPVLASIYITHHVGTHIHLARSIMKANCISSFLIWSVSLWTYKHVFIFGTLLTHCGRVTQICVFDTVNLGTSASSP